MTATLKLGRLQNGIAFLITGRGTFAQSRTLDQLASAFRTECPEARVVIDLSRCDYLDSTFLGCLVRQSRKRRGEQGEVTVLVSEQGREKLFGSNHLDRFLPLQIGSIEPVDGWETLADSTGDHDQLGRHVLESHRCLGELEIPDAAAFRSIAERLAEELNQDRRR